MRNKAAEFSANCVIDAKYNLVIGVSLHVPILMASSGSDSNGALTSMVLSSVCGKQQCGAFTTLLVPPSSSGTSQALLFIFECRWITREYFLWQD